MRYNHANHGQKRDVLTLLDGMASLANQIRNSGDTLITDAIYTIVHRDTRRLMSVMEVLEQKEETA